MGLQEELTAALDSQRVTTGADELRRHGTDEGWHAPAAPDLVVFPHDTEEAAAVVRICRDHGTPIVPFGAGTSLEGHVAALDGGVSVDTTEMNRILRLSVEDMDVTVQAGVTRRQLDGKLRPEGVFFSVDPGADATIGGMVATGASGTTSVRYGTMRENTLSLTVVTADGEIVRTRSRARKSSAGYDLTRLFVGSEGTLGLITEVTLRVQPTPESMTAAACAFETLAGAVDCVIEVLAHAIPVARIELLDDVQIDAVNRHFELELTVGPTLLMEFHGTPADTAAQAEEVRAIADTHGVSGFDWAADESERRRALARSPRRLRGGARAAAGRPRLHHRRLRADLAAGGVHRRDQGRPRRVGPDGADRRARRRRKLPPRDPRRPRRPRRARARQGPQRPARAPGDRDGRHLHRRARRRLRQGSRSWSSSTARPPWP